MDTIGLDLHKRESLLCILTTDGEMIEPRIATTRDRFTAVLGSLPRARILLEASARASPEMRRRRRRHHSALASPNAR